MSDRMGDLGTVQALLDRLVKQRLPRLTDIKTRVDAGARLSEIDIAFLHAALVDAQETAPYVARHPELHALGVRIGALYADIIRVATENETRA
ncbi:hypothetical protein [Lysobacter claricitrinus]|uniref:hypothetical protein n=1 Tax=Lysobacter claricitrinus TaxID=3367728 RepID=UPI0037DA875B